MHEQVFPGRTEMAQRMRELDWSRTALGPVEQWPQSLKTSVSTCLDSAFPFVLYWGSEFTVLYNDEYRACLGPKHPEALGQPAAVVWAEIWDVIRPMLTQVMERGEATRARDLLLHIDRGYPEEAYFSFSFSSINAEEGKRGGIFCPVIETTERVIGERRLRLLRDLAARCKGAESEGAAFDAAAEVLRLDPQDVPFALIYRVDENGTIARLDAAAGIEPGEAASPLTVPLESDQGGVWSFASVARSGQPVLLTDLAARFADLPTGAWKTPPHSAMVLPVLLPGQDRPHAIVVAAVSPMRALDEDYRTFYGLVATQIAAGLADARAMEEERRRAEALAEIDRAKTTFFSNVSHEFRTPLTLMLGPLEDVLANAHGTLPAEAVQALTVAYRNALRLQKLVNTLLDFSRIEAGRVDASYEPTDLAALTAELASVFRSAVEKADLKLFVDTTELAEPAYVDRDMWEKIVLNLLSNALKFTFEGSITVALRPNGDWIELTVADTGVGIAAADLPRMFQRFNRVKNTRSRTHEGTGIGLALVQELARLHGGEASVRSQEGKGSTFTVSIRTGHAHLPADRIGAARQLASTSLTATPYIEEALRWLPAGGPGSDAEQGLPPSPALHDEARSRVLLADDNADMRDYVRRLLEPHYDVVTVSDGQAALEQIRAAVPDLVLSDVMMPGLDGFGLIAAVRADERTRTLPVILLSARAGEESRIEGLAAGADDYLIKPFSARELLARVASQLEQARIRREAEEALRYRSEQFETLLNAAPLGVYLMDGNLRIRSVNPIALPVFGDIPGGVVGRDFDEIIHLLWEKDYADELVRIFRHTLETGEPYLAPERANFRIDRGVTEYYEWRLDRITLPDGSYGLVCYFRDISAQVNARKVIEESREALREADRRKDEFLATLAHELRAPLAPLRNSVSILRMAGSGGGAAERVYEIVDRQVNHMVRLVDDLMEVSRITRGNIELRKEETDLASVVQVAVETTKPLIEAARHQLTINLPPEPVPVDGDPVRLAQVLANLLNNAVKYTPDGGRIWLTVQRDGPIAVVSVRDNGTGIPGDTLPKVFDLFVQAERTYNRSQGGLGIGLTLARSLVNMHGGSIEARSEGPGRGSEFIVRLPAKARPVAARADGTRDGRPAAMAARRILVVDDSRDAADSLAILLKFLGADVKVVNNGLAAIDAIASYRPAVAILDIGMPGMDGYEVARRIRQQPGGSDVMLIALTGWGQEQDRLRSSEAGIDHHLVKPVDVRVLEHLLQSDAKRVVPTVKTSAQAASAST